MERFEQWVNLKHKMSKSKSKKRHLHYEVTSITSCVCNAARRAVIGWGGGARRPDALYIRSARSPPESQQELQQQHSSIMKPTSVLFSRSQQHFFSSMKPVFLLFCLLCVMEERADACSCAISHPQDAYCHSDIGKQKTPSVCVCKCVWRTVRWHSLLCKCWYLLSIRRSVRHCRKSSRRV